MGQATKKAKQHKEDEAWQGIGKYAEGVIHAGIKEFYGSGGDCVGETHTQYSVEYESSHEGKVIDLIRTSKNKKELIEIQTQGFGKIQGKILGLAKKNKVRLVYPVATKTWIVRLDPVSQEVLSRRASPKKGQLFTIFDELVYAPSLINQKNLSIEIIYIEKEEIKVRDGSGSFWKKGDRLLSRKIISIGERHTLSTKKDYLKLLPKELNEAWTVPECAKLLGIQKTLCRKMLYSYVKIGLLEDAGKQGRFKLYRYPKK